jgi:hypothetical protein
MLSWSTIAYGAVLSAVVAAVLAYAASRRASVTLLAGVAAAAGPLAWNAVLRATHAREFFTDAPLAVMPASWQGRRLDGGTPEGYISLRSRW